MPGPLRFDDEAAWLEFRKGRVGGSLIGAVLGLDDAYDTPLAAYHQLIGLDTPKVETIAMTFGKMAQRLLASVWCGDNLPVDFYEDVHEEETWTHPLDERFSCTLDYRVDTDLPCLVECKTTGNRGRWANGVPASVEAQARWQLGIVRANHISVDVCHVVAAFVPGWQIKSWTVEHDDDTFDAMMRAAVNFLRHHVDARIPPRAVAYDLDRLTATAGTDDDALIATGDLAADLHAAAFDYHDRAARARETAKDADEAKAVLYQLMGDHTAAWVEGDTERKPLVEVGRRARTSVSLKGMDPDTLAELERLGYLTTTEYPTLKVRP
jgi:hypothetical protein